MLFAFVSLASLLYCTSFDARSDHAYPAMTSSQEQQQKQQQGDVMAALSNPLESDGLCLLSIDGGGVRGLASLYILKYVMDRLNNVLHEPKDHDQPRLKPCDVFDLIGGTSTGGYHPFVLFVGYDETLVHVSAFQRSCRIFQIIVG